ncbi:MAG: TIM barrel protein, partial [Clostridia bacterium]|nr:TIM barrel protein [Clostridia bacterium]
MKQWDIGASTCGRKVLTDSVFEGYKNAGIKYMEISLKNLENYDDPDAKTEAIISHDAKRIKSAAKNDNVRIWSLHLPFGAGYYDISCAETEKRENAIQKYSRLIEYASDIGAEIVVLHPSFEP